MKDDPRSYERNYMQLRKEAWKKFRTSTGLEPVTSRYRCDALPTELWSHWRWEQVNFGFICSRESEECKWCIWIKSYELRKWNQMKVDPWRINLHLISFPLHIIAFITARINLHLVHLFPCFFFFFFYWRFRAVSRTISFFSISCDQRNTELLVQKLSQLIASVGVYGWGKWTECMCPCSPLRTLVRIDCVTSQKKACVLRRLVSLR